MRRRFLAGLPDNEAFLYLSTAFSLKSSFCFKDFHQGSFLSSLLAPKPPLFSLVFLLLIFSRWSEPTPFSNDLLFSFSPLGLLLPLLVYFEGEASLSDMPRTRTLLLSPPLFPVLKAPQLLPPFSGKPLVALLFFFICFLPETDRFYPKPCALLK